MSMIRFAPLLLLAVPATAVAQSMPVATFIAKADALQRKGPLALFSSDLKLLKNEIGGSGKAIRAEQMAATKAGQPTDLCMPARATINSSELMNHLKSIPVASRAMPFHQAMRAFIVRKYPCPS